MIYTINNVYAMVDKIKNLKGEKWKRIKGYNGKYKVSNMGRVKSLNPKQKEAKLMKQSFLSKGRKYKRVNILGKYFLVHRLVLMTFEPITNLDGMVCNHIDHNPTNNMLSNLEWATQKENVQKAVQYGHKPDNAGEKNGRSKLSVHDVKKIREQFAIGATTTQELSEQYNISKGNINCIIKMRSWKNVA